MTIEEIKEKEAVADEVMIKTASIYVLRHYALSAEIKKADDPKAADTLNRERVVIEYNYDCAKRLYELDKSAFCDSFGKYVDMSLQDIYYDILLGGFDNDRDVT